MRLRAKSFWYEDHCTIKDAIITSSRLSIDFQDEGRDGHLQATSEDGVYFRGTYGYRQLDSWRHAEFQLYKSHDGNVALVGRWHEDGGEAGTWLILAEPEKT